MTPHMISQTFGMKSIWKVDTHLVRLEVCLHTTQPPIIPDKASSSWIGDWWKGRVSLVCLCVLRLSDPSRLTQSPSDTHLRDRLTPTRSDPLSTTQIYSNSFDLTRIR